METAQLDIRRREICAYLMQMRNLLFQRTEIVQPAGVRKAIIASQTRVIQKLSSQKMEPVPPAIALRVIIVSPISSHS